MKTRRKKKRRRRDATDSRQLKFPKFLMQLCLLPRLRLFPPFPPCSNKSLQHALPNRMKSSHLKNLLPNKLKKPQHYKLLLHLQLLKVSRRPMEKNSVNLLLSLDQNYRDHLPRCQKEKDQGQARRTATVDLELMNLAWLRLPTSTSRIWRSRRIKNINRNIKGSNLCRDLLQIAMVPTPLRSWIRTR
jgi:hypothetical protein